MVPWNQRPVEANLYNPAFCAFVLYQAVDAYQKVTGLGMSYPVAFVVLPVVLHKPTRESLPRSVSTKLHVWLQDHHEVRIGFAQRMQQLVPITKEALLFAMQHDALTLDELGALVVTERPLAKYAVDKDSEAAACVKKAEFIGRWFASITNPVTLLASWGIKF